MKCSILLCLSLTVSAGTRSALVELRIKVGAKGLILIPKVFRDSYGLKEGDVVVIEPEEGGVLIRGRRSPQETEQEIERHVSELKTKEVILLAEEDLQATERYLTDYDVKPSDAIHLATMDKLGITSIVSEDAELDAVKGIKRVWLDTTGQRVTETGHEGP